MKTQSVLFAPFVLMTILLTSGASARAASITTDQLAIQCDATVQVVSQSNIKYTPALPPHGRFNGRPDHAGFNAKVKVVETAPECEVLSSKYGIDLGAELDAYVTLISPHNQEATEHLAASYKHGLFPLTLTQRFGYVINGKYLPHYPEAYSETLTWMSHLDHATMSIQLPFSLEKAHGTKPVASLNDAEKLELATKIFWQLLFQAKTDSLISNGSYGGLFLSLEPTAVEAKKSYASLLIKLFKEIKEQGPYTRFFDFNVGGYGAFEGASFAAKLSHLSHVPGVVTSKQVLEIMSLAPQILISGHTADTTINASPELIEQWVTDLAEQIDTLTGKQKSALYWVMPVLAKKHGTISGINPDTLTAKTVELAQYIQSKLNP